VTAHVTDEELGSLHHWILDGVELFPTTHHEMHGRLMAAGAIAQPGSGENLKPLVPVYNHRPYKPPSGDSSLGTYRQGSDQPFARWPRSQVQRQSSLCAGVTGCQSGEIAVLAPAHELDDKPSAADA
jgi:hypothetical protein